MHYLSGLGYNIKGVKPITHPHGNHDHHKVCKTSKNGRSPLKIIGFKNMQCYNILVMKIFFFYPRTQLMLFIRNIII